MQKKQYWNVKTLVFMALLIAMHLVLTRVLVIDLGAYRISVGSVCTILAGLWLGPVAGGVCGLCADIIGCFMKGYAVNPFITVAAILWGVLPCETIVCKQKENRKNSWYLCIYRGDCNSQFSGIYNSWSCNHAWLQLLCDHAGKTGTVCNYDSDLLCTDLPAVLQPADSNGCW